MEAEVSFRTCSRIGRRDLRETSMPSRDGPGLVEAAWKTLVTRRVKCSGMRWRHQGGQAISTLRSLVQCHCFEHAWSLLSMTYRDDVTIPYDVPATPRKRAA